MELVVVFLALMVVAFIYAAKVRKRPSEFQLAVERLAAAFDETKAAIGEALLPAVEQAVAAVQAFADAFSDPERSL